MSHQRLRTALTLRSGHAAVAWTAPVTLGCDCIQASVPLVLIAPSLIAPEACTSSAAQVFLITDKDATPGVFAALSVNLRKYRYVFADIHAGDTAALQRLSITKARCSRAGARSDLLS